MGNVGRTSPSLPRTETPITEGTPSPVPATNVSGTPGVESGASADSSSFETGRTEARRPTVAPGAVPPPPGSADVRAQEAAARRTFETNMPRMSQGDVNSCGTTSMSMALGYLGIPCDFRDADRSIRPWGDSGPGTAPADIVRYARRAGVQAEAYNNGSLEDMAAHVRAGRPVTVLINTDEGNVHYVNVIGFNRDVDGNITGVRVRDPNGGTDHTMSTERFMDRWSDVRLGSVLPTFNRTYIVYDRADAAPLPSPSVVGRLQGATADLFLGGLNGIAGGANNIARGNVISGAGQMLGNSINLIAGVATNAIGNLIGSNIERGGDALLDVAQRLWEGNAGEKVGAAFLFFFGAILKAIGWLLSTIAGALSELVNLITSPLTKPGEAIGQRDELRERLLNTHAQHDPAVTLQRADINQKRTMVDTLLNPMIGGPSTDDQRAALVVLRACTPDERAQLAAHFGGAEQLAAKFEGDQATEARTLLGLPPAAGETAPAHAPDLAPSAA